MTNKNCSRPKPIVRFERPGTHLRASNIYDPIRDVTVTNFYPTEGVEATIECERGYVMERGVLDVFHPAPTTIAITLSGVRGSIDPEVGCAYTVYVRYGEELTTYKMEVVEKDYDLSGRQLIITGVEIPPPALKPCAECAERRLREAQESRLKKAAEKYGREFESLQILEAYEDGYSDGFLEG